MTDTEIIKGLECCMKSTIIDEYCDQCPYKIYNKYCMDKIFSDILDLIDRLTNENKRLTEEVGSRNKRIGELLIEIAELEENLEEKDEFIKLMNGVLY